MLDLLEKDKSETEAPVESKPRVPALKKSMTMDIRKSPPEGQL